MYTTVEDLTVYAYEDLKKLMFLQKTNILCFIWQIILTLRRSKRHVWFRMKSEAEIKALLSQCGGFVFGAETVNWLQLITNLCHF